MKALVGSLSRPCRHALGLPKSDCCSLQALPFPITVPFLVVEPRRLPCNVQSVRSDSGLLRSHTMLEEPGSQGTPVHLVLGWLGEGHCAEHVAAPPTF